MLPVFSEYIKLLNNKTNNDNQIAFLKEGYFWLENQIIKGFDKKGKLHKIVKVNIDKDLNIKITTYKNKNINIEFETWQETSIRLQDRISRLELESLRILSNYKDTDRIIIDTNSTGKNSMVKTYLAKKAGLKFETYFNVTTCDVVDSNLIARRNNYIFTYPDKELKGFYNWRRKENIILSRLNRCCCKYFKEEPTIKSFNSNDKLLLLFGMRNDESSSRSEYENEWVNKKWGKRRNWIGLLPIRKWTDLDIWLYMLRKNIEINPKYKKGYNRVGCGIVCPNYTKSTWVLDKYWYPKMYERWQQILKKDFLDNYKWISVHCTLEEYLQGAWTGGLFRKKTIKRSN